jgi:hypothetical protein
MKRSPLHARTMNNNHSGDNQRAQTSSAKDAIRLATFDQYRGLLFSIAYRMLGTIADAEDMLQETFIRVAPICGAKYPVTTSVPGHNH